MMQPNRSLLGAVKLATAILSISAFSLPVLAQNPMTGAPTPGQQPTVAAPAPMAAPAQAPAPGGVPGAPPASVCGNQPLCFESQDFVATVIDFRTSQAGYYKVLDATVRFQNKTNQPLALGYSNGSGTALDDRSVRYAVGGGNALRGMGLVSGQSGDPKFVLHPGGSGDARFELLGQSQIYGLTYELNLTVNEITLIEGNQHTVGAEFPIQFHALANGVRGTAPGIPAGGFAGVSSLMSGAGSQTCGAAGTLTNVASATNNAGATNAANTATSTVSTTTAAVNNLKSLFGRKKPATDPTQAAAAPCVPAAPASVMPSSVTTSNVAAVANAVKPAATSTAAGVVATPAATNATATPATATTAAKTVTVAKPVTPAKPATTAKPPVKKPAPAPQPAAAATPSQN
jgi:hypothetical protein